MRRIWAATEGIRYIMVCFLIMAVGMVYIVGCGNSGGSAEEGVVTSEVEAEEVNPFKAYADQANHLCAAHEGVQQIIREFWDGYSTSEDQIEMLICRDGVVVPWEE